MTLQSDFWQGDGGKAYTARNRVAWQARIPFWDRVLPTGFTGRILEVGCNFGPNLFAIRAIRPKATIVGIDVNGDALLQAWGSNLDAELCPAQEIQQRFGQASFDIVFTAGLLIHLPYRDLIDVVGQMMRVASKFVIAIEYDSPMPRSIEYQGRPDLLWARPFGEIFQSLGGVIVQDGDAEGFNSCHYWMIEP